MYFRYAEQFHLEPDIDAICERTKVRTWLRWLLRDKAIQARQAWEHANQSTDWTKDLTPGEREMMHWGEEESNANTD